MSWFNRKKPKIRETPHLPAYHRSSPITQRVMEEAKKTGPSQPKPKKPK